MQVVLGDDLHQRLLGAVLDMGEVAGDGDEIPALLVKLFQGGGVPVASQELGDEIVGEPKGGPAG